jgi:hypothetical protein
MAARGLPPERVCVWIVGFGAGAHCVGAYIPGIVVGGASDVGGAGALDHLGDGGGAANRAGGAGVGAGPVTAVAATAPAVTGAASAVPQWLQ